MVPGFKVSGFKRSESLARQRATRFRRASSFVRTSSDKLPKVEVADSQLVNKRFKCSSLGRYPKVESSQKVLSSQELAKEHPSNY